jgi:carbon starvation protein CstA
MFEILISVLMLAGIVLIGGAVVVFRSGDRRRALLMIIAALVMFANVAIWTLPSPEQAATAKGAE